MVAAHGEIRRSPRPAAAAASGFTAVERLADAGAMRKTHIRRRALPNRVELLVLLSLRSFLRGTADWPRPTDVPSSCRSSHPISLAGPVWLANLKNTGVVHAFL